MECNLLRFHFYKPLKIRALVFFAVKIHFMAIQFKRTIFASKETIKIKRYEKSNTQYKHSLIIYEKRFIIIF